jgi:tetratricopeptide (TPR) repeat protein
MATTFLSLRGALALFAAILTLTLPASSQAEALSEMLNQRIIDAQRAEAERLFEVALNNYANALQISANTPHAKRLLLKKRAGLYEQIKMMEKAEADLTAAFKIEPLDPKAFADRGYFYMRQGRYSEALDDFISGSRADPKDAMFLHGAGRVLVAKRDDTNAIKFFNEAMQIAPRDVKLHLARAEARLRLHDYQEAAADYDEAIAIGLKEREQRHFGFVGRGYASLMMADFGSAVRFFDRALEISPDASNVLLLRGYAYERQGARDLALRDYERAGAGMSDLAQARHGIARLRANVVGTTPAPALNR